MTHGPWLRPVVGDTEWRRRAACKGMDPALFYPERGESTAEIRAVCGGCEVREECLDFALANREEWGTWGGLGERARKRVRRSRAAGKPDGLRQCKRCGGWLPSNAFGRTPNGSHLPRCRDCEAEYHAERERAYYHARRDRARERAS